MWTFKLVISIILVTTFPKISWKFIQKNARNQSSHLTLGGPKYGLEEKK